MKIFGRCSEGLVLHTRRAHQISIPQLSVLVHPTTTTPINIELYKMTSEIKTGANSLHRRSIRRVTALRCVSVYDDDSRFWLGDSLRSLDGDCGCSVVAVVVAARMGTHSRSMAIMFPIPLRFSHIPRPITIANTHTFIVLLESRPFLLVGDPGLMSKSNVRLIKPGRRSAGRVDVEGEEGEVKGPGTRKIQPRHATSTETRFADIVMRRVRIRDGALSIHRPTKEDRHRAAKVVHKPLFNSVDRELGG